MQDNEKGTWNAYENRYWSQKYLIDSDGYVRYDHNCEGAYAETEKVIQSLLAERTAEYADKNFTIDQSISESQSSQSVNFDMINKQELYFGYEYSRTLPGNSIFYYITSTSESFIRPVMIELVQKQTLYRLIPYFLLCTEFSFYI